MLDGLADKGPHFLRECLRKRRRRLRHRWNGAGEDAQKEIVRSHFLRLKGSARNHYTATHVGRRAQQVGDQHRCLVRVNKGGLLKAKQVDGPNMALGIL